MRVTARFSDGIARLLDGAAIGDEFDLVVRARIVAAEEALIDVSQLGADDPTLIQGDLEVTLLLSHPERVDQAFQTVEREEP